MEHEIYDFDSVVDRRGTDASKYEEMEAKFGRQDLLPLWIADMDFPACHYITEALRRRLDHPVLGYTAPPEAYWHSITDWLRRRHGFEVKREELTFVPGVKKALGLCINYFTRPGDKIVIQPPVYHSFRSVIEGSGRQVVNNPLARDTEGKYHIDFEGMEQVIAAERPAMMILCNPHNPIGLQWDAETLRRVADICYEHGLVLISDEIYSDMMLDGRKHIATASVSQHAADVTVTLGAPTKTFNIEGIVSAWTVVKNPRMRNEFFRWLDASEFNEPPIAAIVATQAAYDHCEPWLDQVLAYLQANVDYAVKYINANIPSVKAYEPEASFVMWLDFSALCLEQHELVHLLVDDAKVALSDGITFGEAGRGFMRINLGVPRTVLTQALERIARAVNSYQQQHAINAKASAAIPFTKMQGLGNDYAYINCFDGEPQRLSELAVEMSRAIGTDGIILICKPQTAEGDLRMRIFNADGSEAQMCGNGIRCVAKYVYDKGLKTGTSLSIETLGGLRQVEMHPGQSGRVERVTVDMGLPITEPSQVPVTFDGSFMHDVPVRTSRGDVRITAVSMGNPHGVTFVDEFDDDMVSGLGHELENHAIWPERANIEFVRADDAHTLAMRVWERGAGETMACGTGACASAVAAVLTGRAQWPVTVRLLGGNLQINRGPATGHILLTGPAETVFDGTYYRQD